MHNIAWLEELHKGAIAVAGGKGANLGEMIRAGLPVPPGFVLTTAAYRSHLESADLPARIATRLQGLDQGDLPAVEAASQEVMTWIERTPIPEILVDEVITAYETLTTRVSTPLVAVRSSATAEDLPDASFAGQQETYLNLQGAGALLEAIRRCWASLWAPRAISYRAQMGYDHLGVSLAVVVQAMIPAEVAGVMFTANPVSGSPNELLVTASYGLGEAVVSGVVTPDSFVLDQEGRVLQRTCGAKEVCILPGANGIHHEPVEPALRRKYCLSEGDLITLARLGRQVAAHYGAPQDTEWALAGGQFYLLQARPITTIALGYVGPKLSRMEVWAHALSLDNTMDHWPEPLKPLDAAIYRLANWSLSTWFAEFGAKGPAGHSYYEELPDGRIAPRPHALRPRLPILWRVPAWFLRALREEPGVAWPRLRADLLTAIEPVEQADLAMLATPALADGIERLLQAYQQELPHRFSTVFTAGIVFEALTKLFTRLALGRNAAANASRTLFTALPYSSGAMSRDAARLAQVAVAHGKESETFRQALTEFLTHWGSRPTKGMEPLPSIPTWRDEPSAVLGMVDALMADPTALDVDTIDHQQTVQFTATREQVAARLSPLFRRWFLHSLDMARRYVVTREESLSYHERLCGALRRLVLELGARLAAGGQISQADDVFYILESELGAAARGQRDLKPQIARRKRAYQRVVAAHQRGENWIVASGGLPPAVLPRRRAREGHLLVGVGASHGRVTGKVCVVRDLAEASRLEKGDILVTPMTSPAWTPLFSLAGGIVTDVGGPLSHAAIVAREMGIPAVLGTKRATSLLTDGQRITVDGTGGFIAAAPAD